MTAPRRSRRCPPPATIGAAVLALLAVSACTSSAEKATADATEQVRASAHNARDLLQGLVSAPDTPRGQALLDRARERLAVSPDVIVYDEQVRTDGAVALRTAFHARRESGGLAPEAVVVRLCVELTAAPGPPPAAEVRDAECAPTLPRTTGNAGNVNTTVTLEG